MTSRFTQSFRSHVRTLAVAATLACGAFGSSAEAQSLPQECDMTEEMAFYGEAGVGATIRLGYHTPVYGDAFWVPEMSAYVGRVATVTSLDGVDDSGCPVVRVDIDEEEFAWRIRNARLVSPATTVSAHSSGDVFVVSSRGTEANHAVFGDVGDGTMPVSRLTPDGAGLIDLQHPAATIRHNGTTEFQIFVDSEVDTVLLVQTPTGEFVFVDDTDDLNPASGPFFAPGTYHVWVGSYDAGDFGTFSMLVSSDTGVSMATAPGLMRRAR